MEAFKIDEQTFTDLEIFSNVKGFSIYSLFKNCKTLGGRIALESMMRNPTNDVALLQNRQDAIRYFYHNEKLLNLDYSSFDLILHYFSYGKGYLRGNLIDSSIVYLKKIYRENPDVYIVQIGLKNLLDLIRQCYAIVELKKETGIPNFLLALIARINEIISDPKLSGLQAFSQKKKLSFLELAKLDELVRGKGLLLLHNLLDVLYLIDALQTVGEVGKSKAYCFPNYLLNSEEIQVSVKKCYHPAITDSVTNDFVLKGKSLVFLTGSNMSGKSSFLKTVGICIYLAHIGFPVPAAQMHTTAFDGLMSTINLSDSLSNGLSHYYSEVMRVKNILEIINEKKKMFILLDELFKGTNASDAATATKLVLQGFSNIRSSVFFVSSHITEIAEEFDVKNISLMYMEHQMKNGVVEFTRKLREGISTDGFGLCFLEKENIFELLNQAKFASI